MIKKERQALKLRQQNIVKVQKKYYNKRTINIKFKVSNKVILQSKNIQQLRPSKKLVDYYLSSFEITKVIEIYY